MFSFTRKIELDWVMLNTSFCLVQQNLRQWYCVTLPFSRHVFNKWNKNSLCWNTFNFPIYLFLVRFCLFYAESGLVFNFSFDKIFVLVCLNCSRSLLLLRPDNAVLRDCELRDTLGIFISSLIVKWYTITTYAKWTNWSKKFCWYYRLSKRS